MRLATPAAVVKQFGTSESSGTLQAAGVALDATLLQLEAKLEISATEKSVTDYFTVQRAVAGTVLRTQYGLIRKVVVRETPDGVLPADKISGVVVDPQYYSVDAKAGTVTLLYAPRNGYNGISVSYKVGYAEDSNGVAEDVEPWLVQLATAVAALSMHSNPMNVSKDKTSTMRPAIVSQTHAIATSVSPYLRPRVGMLWSNLSVDGNG